MNEPERAGSSRVGAGRGEAGSANVGQSSVGELLSEVTSDLSKLLSQEVALAKAEVSQEAAKAKTIGTAFGAAAAAGYFLLLFASLTLAYGLGDLFDHLWLGALVVTGLYAIATAVLVAKGRAAAKSFNPKPEQTIESLKEDAQWAKTRNS